MVISYEEENGAVYQTFEVPDDFDPPAEWHDAGISGFNANPLAISPEALRAANDSIGTVLAGDNL
jgi:hypothetical protein